MDKVMEIEFKLAKKKAKLVCHNCMKVFKGHFFYLTMIKPDGKGAIWTLEAPTVKKPAFCAKCMEKRKREDREDISRS